jgi:hypothetical protein
MGRGIQFAAHDAGNRPDAGADDDPQQQAGQALQREENDPRRNQKTSTAGLAVIVRILPSHCKNLLEVQIGLLYHKSTGKKREKTRQSGKTTRIIPSGKEK